MDLEIRSSQRTKIDFPVLLDDLKPSVHIYSIESVIAEKLEAIVDLGFLNSRYKDFYDICMLSRNFSFDGEHLKEAIKKTFVNRNTSINHVAAFEESFVSDLTHLKRWKAFLNKKDALSDLSLSDAVTEIRLFISPVLEALLEGNFLNTTWNHESLLWE